MIRKLKSGQYRLFHLGHGRAEPFEETLTRLGKRDTARRPMKEPHTELCLQTTDRIAQAGPAFRVAIHLSAKA
jgi:hypothetical protein